MSWRGAWAAAVVAACSCSSSSAPHAGSDGAAAGSDGGARGDAAAACGTRITYGSAWIKAADHPAQFDDVDGPVTWDGVCTDDAHGNSSATLSNGF